jgi:hypothetical protein
MRFLSGSFKIRDLITLLAAAYLVALMQWLLSPPIAKLWMPVTPPGMFYWAVLFALSAAWLMLTIAALIRCGAPGLLALLSAPWGLLPILFWGGALWTCFSSGFQACL